MVKRIAAIVIILVIASIAWMILGGSTSYRTYSQTSKLHGKMEGLWGSAHTQHAPFVYYESKEQKKVQKENAQVETIIETRKYRVSIEASNIDVGFKLTHRKKGLLWYDTYKVEFVSKYKIRNPLPRQEEFKIDFSFPAQNTNYDNFRFVVNKKPIDIYDFSMKSITVPVTLAKDQEIEIEIGYISQGLDKWFYKFGDSVSSIKNFSLNMTTDFRNIDFPENTISPSTKEQTATGWKLNWSFKNLISGFQIGMDMPNKLNPGPLASRISFFAPVSLIFFFFVVFMISVIKNIKIHPMNYFFLAAAFFAFHLLFSYTVDHLDIYLAFLISSVVSMFLVISYMRIVAGARFAAIEVGISQFIFLILFSLAHFFEGYTGLTVTVGGILTLGIMMRLTAKINWEEKFKSSKETSSK